ncbi:MAG: addiction module toxin RelE [Proteobacteria bacterium]|nr:addiction module toxin RelE [Pseudomonadota bacterium]NOG59415.1 addiction module toxin RelE [Pseudomonadota bacterium]
MSRPLRIEYAGAVYHITSRGNARSNIYTSDTDRKEFIKIITQTCERYNWHCYAWCLMSNHYHLVIETAEANLSRGMRHLNGVYTQTYNRTHKRVGHLFQGRYKAILVEKESYLLEVVRYVLLNPVRANITKTAGQYRWSSYRAMIDKAEAPQWLDKDWILGHYGKRQSTAQKNFIQFIREGKKQSPLWENLRQQLYLGDEQFINKLQSKQVQDKDLSEITKEQRQCISKPIDYYIKKYDHRDEAIYKAYKEGAHSQKEIADYFKLHYSTVSKIIKKYEEEMV